MAEDKGKPTVIRSGGRLDWDKLRVFHAVAEAGSFTHASEGWHPC